MTEIPAPTTEHDILPVPRRYRSVNAPDGDLLIYDGEHNTRWIQSDAHVPLGTMR